MRTKSFQLEETVPGSFFFQGLAGGMLGGFIFVATMALWVQENPPSNWVIPLTPIYMLMGAIVGVVKAAFMWGVYRITRLQIRVMARVLATTICIGLFAGFIYYKAGVTDDVLFATGVAVAWLTALPVALSKNASPQLELARRRRLVSDELHAKLKTQLEEISRMLSGLINGLDNRET